MLQFFLKLIKPVIKPGLFILLGILFQSYGLIDAIFDTYWEDITYLLNEHLYMIAISGGLAILIGVPVGILLSRPSLRKVSDLVMQIFNLGSTVPTLAILALSMSFLGIGKLPAIIAICLATLLPIIRNTHTGILDVNPALLEAARGMGMKPMEILFKVEIPNALVIIMAGIKTAISINVGTVPLAFLIGGGGLGELIFTGIALAEPLMMLSGSVITAMIVIVADSALRSFEFFIIPKGINPFLIEH